MLLKCCINNNLHKKFKALSQINFKNSMGQEGLTLYQYRNYPPPQFTVYNYENPPNST